ncbi:uncharacterized protein LOC112271919 [Brachypodium distachyon]|uniref:Pectinesterase inhibitor domain-containing protein n=1 Tax=Brachypodium distachyon TaxID=15368 RepID=I1I0V6_BRADI|nr:uncharacterized protein LOC112271919 [Brachypodium distachyon]KQJ95035.1 hypothetical protein BRADI_3g14810v3 [Brachypodium distachyon]|eukprot:XP_024317945.1 uncharacterized protein LOC112271919 [Brachypodium distachyon]
MKTILLLVLLLLASPSMIAGGGKPRCPGVQSLTPAAACKAATGTALMFFLCMDTLREFTAAGAEEATLYALLAAQHALKTMESTEARTRGLIGGGALSGDQKLAYASCLGDYADAERSMGRAARELLPRCELAGLGIRRGIDLGLEKCRDRLVRIGAPEPLSGLVLSDRNRAALAYFLSKFAAPMVMIL